MDSKEDVELTLLDHLGETFRKISGLPDCRTVAKKMYCNLVRRIKLLGPLFEELKDGGEEIPEEVVGGFQLLSAALSSALDLLNSLHHGSKMLQALQLELISGRFHEITAKIEEALCHIPYSTLDITDEVKEQIELVHTQFKRARGRPDSPDVQSGMDLGVAMNERDPDPAILRRLSEKLYLRTIHDLKRESLAIDDMVTAHGEYPEERFKRMSYVLKMMKDCVILENPELDASESGKGIMKSRSPVIPDDFRCPISLDLMKDPVIVSSGQTYERSYIQKWLNAGHKTCPKTQQTLWHTALTPNYVLKSLIALWCESNGVELPASIKCMTLPQPDQVAITRDQLFITADDDRQNVAPEQGSSVPPPSDSSGQMHMELRTRIGSLEQRFDIMEHETEQRFDSLEDDMDTLLSMVTSLHALKMDPNSAPRDPAVDLEERRTRRREERALRRTNRHGGEGPSMS